MNQGKWTTSKITTYFNVRLVSDAKHFPANGDKPACTFITIVDETKGGETFYIDAKVTYGAEKAGGLKKGDEVTVIGTVEFKTDEKTGKVKGKIWNATLQLGSAARASIAASAAESAAPPSDSAPAADTSAPAFD